ncbi:hypothetical protein A2960_05560 [Candidatus Gottesmanbacteria bacterium RIFCSPLOWO2_01_FULL_39_12b]|uniref:Uncharacterized protein n=1 Tax=Candidatus Gottesmanbacteria bacterium RIFCSPLOWO2_01_FULL_39_12b TaxID=1798388 RepID=A0A1F6ANS2_9BACT|nr:MAG: hypothetical protein A2960_05560 [Candidatus Gottesmanbacteria bacterium RIFCSPLOWO2_01_FULL_39_12b]
MNDNLAGKERIIVWIANLVNPLIAGFLFYHAWKKIFRIKQSRLIEYRFWFLWCIWWDMRFTK